MSIFQGGHDWGTGSYPVGVGGGGGGGPKCSNSPPPPPKKKDLVNDFYGEVIRAHTVFRDQIILVWAGRSGRIESSNL